MTQASTQRVVLKELGVRTMRPSHVTGTMVGVGVTGGSGPRAVQGSGPAVPGQLAIVVNPIARDAARAVTAVVHECRRRGLPTPICLATSVREPGYTQANQALAQGARVVVAIGGDGTIRHVVRALAGTPAVLGIVARGTGNLLAHNLGLPCHDVGEQVAVAVGGLAARIDVGWARGQSPRGRWGEEPFTTMAGIGRDARAVACTALASKRRLGWWAYAAAGLVEAQRRALPMSVRIDDEEPRDVLTWTVLIGNTPAAPGRIRVWPHARPDDGVLDVLEVPIRHRWQWLGVADKGLVHYDRDVAALRYGRGRRVAVRTPQPLPVQLDGDVMPRVTDLRVRVDHLALSVHVRAEPGRQE